MSLPKRHFHYKSHVYYHTQPSEMIKYPHGTQEYLKKVLIYYPKSFIATSLISTEIHKIQRFQKTSRRYLQDQNELAHLIDLYSRVISKYKPELLSIHQSIYSAYNPTLKSHISDKLYRASKSLSSFRSERRTSRLHLSPQVGDYHQRLLRANKRLRKFDCHSTIESLTDILKYLKYLPSLKSFSVSEAPNNLLEDLRLRVLSASRNYLETVTLVNRNKESWSPAIIRSILEQLPRLKKLNIDIKNSSINLNEIPFNVIKKRNISYYMRLPNSAVPAQLSISTEIGLENIDFLKLHLSNFNVNALSKWDALLEDRWQKQRNSQRCLILDRIERDKNKLNELFRSCRNITTLDLHLEPFSHEDMNIFEGIQYLTNLKHVFIKLKSIYSFGRVLSYQARSLFTGLNHCSQALESISLEVCGDIGINVYETQVLSFFKKCSNTLRKVTLKFAFIKCKTRQELAVFYTAILKLQQLTSLNIIIYNDRNRIEEDLFEEHANRLKELTIQWQCETLQELSISAPNISLEKVDIGLGSLKKVRKLLLGCYTIEANSLFHKDLLHLNSLQILELILGNLNEKTWYKLLNNISFLKVLGILNLKIENLEVIKEDAAVTDLGSWVSNFKTLKCAAYGQGADPDIISVIVRDFSSYAGDCIDRFFGRGLRKIPEKRFHKLFIV